MPRVASQLGIPSAMIAGVSVIVLLLAEKAHSCVKTAEIAESPPSSMNFIQKNVLFFQYWHKNTSK
jgi:hypothetical protein